MIWSLIDRYSSLSKLCRVTVWLRRALAKFQRKRTLGPLTPAEITDAELFWVRQTQHAHFREEIRILQSQQLLPRSSPLLRLTPFIGKDGILRVGGRLKHSTLDPDARHPRILPRDATLSRLIISSAHLKTLHGGTQLTLATLRRSYWILGGRAPIQHFIRRCVKCVRYRAKLAQQQMGQLPMPSVTPNRPFLHSGVDYARF